MQTPQAPKTTKRRALLALLGATPVLAYGQGFEPGGIRYEYKPKAKAEDRISLLHLNLTLPEPRDGKALFLQVTVNGKEELAISVDEALEILKEPGPAVAECRFPLGRSRRTDE